MAAAPAAAQPAGSAIWIHVDTVLPGVPEPYTFHCYRDRSLSLLIVSSGVWIGVRWIGERTFFPNRRDGTYDWPGVEASLRSHKASGFFIDRTDIEIAARSGASYQALIRAMSAANVAGFIDVGVTDETELPSTFCSDDVYDVSDGCRSYPFEQLTEQWAVIERGKSIL